MKTAFMRRLAQGSGLSLVKLVAGLFKIKILALLLGVEGLGLLSLGLQFQATAVALVSMSLAVGVINLGRPLLVAENAEAAGAVLGTALALVAVNSLTLLAAVALLQDAIVGSGLGKLQATGTGLIWPLAFAAVIVSFANVLWEGLSFLVDRFDIYVRTNMAGALFDALLFAGGAWLFGVKGALFASLLSSLLLFLAYAILSAEAPVARKILAHLSVAGSWVRPLLSFSVLMLVSAAAGLAALFLARAHLTAIAGDAANGYLQVATALAAYLQPFVMTGVWGHLHPAAAASGDTGEARVELRRTLTTSMRLAAAGCVSVVVGAPVLVQLVYTSAFLKAWQYFSVYFIGELFYMFVSVLGVYLLAVGHKRAYFLGYAFYHGGLLAGVWMSAEAIGAWSYVLSHVAAATSVATLAIFFGLRSGMLDRATLRPVGVYIAAAAVVCLLDHLKVDLSVASMQLRASWILGPIVIGFLMHPFLQRLLHWPWGWGLR
jgi:O-antigen/teichoic acid export membrane protein